MIVWSEEWENPVVAQDLVTPAVVLGDHVSIDEADRSDHRIGDRGKDDDCMMMERKEGEDDSQQQDDCIDADQEGVLFQNTEDPDNDDYQTEQNRKCSGQSDDPHVCIVTDRCFAGLIFQDLVVDGDVEQGFNDGDDEA